MNRLKWFVTCAVSASGLLALSALLAAAPDAGAAAARSKPVPPTASTRTRLADQQKQIDAQAVRIAEQRLLLDTRQAVADSQSVTIREQQEKLRELRRNWNSLSPETRKQILRKIRDRENP